MALGTDSLRQVIPRWMTEFERRGGTITIHDAGIDDLERYAKQSDAQPTFSRELTQVVDGAEREAKALGDEYISTEHLLLALSDAKGTDSTRVLTGAGAHRQDVEPTPPGEGSGAPSWPVEVRSPSRHPHVAAVHPAAGRVRAARPSRRARRAIGT